MNDDEYVPETPPACPGCGGTLAWQPPARRTESGAWEADFSCPNGHRVQIVSKAKRRPTAD